MTMVHNVLKIHKYSDRRVNNLGLLLQRVVDDM